MEIDIKKYHGLTGDAWQLFKKYSALSSKSDTGWETYIADVDKIIAKYDTENDVVARRILIGFMNAIEEAVKEGD